MTTSTTITATTTPAEAPVEFAPASCRDLMIDLETLATREDAAILEIAAVLFDPATGTTGAEYEITVDVLSQLAAGRRIDRSTLDWHRARGALDLDAAAYTLPDALSELSLWIRHEARPRAVWAWGSDFDAGILRHAFASLPARLPWHFTATRDARTVWKLAFPGTAPESRIHSALSDCHAQVRDLCAALQNLHRIAS